MPTAWYTLRIHAQPEDVFDVWAEYNSWSDWNPLVSSSNGPTDDSAAVGREFTVHYIIGTATYRIIQYERPAYLELKVVEGGLSPEMRYKITSRATGHGCEMTLVISIKFTGARMLLVPSASLGAWRRVRMEAKAVKEYIEH